MSWDALYILGLKPFGKALEAVSIISLTKCFSPTVCREYFGAKKLFDSRSKIKILPVKPIKINGKQKIKPIHKWSFLRNLRKV